MPSPWCEYGSDPPGKLIVDDEPGTIRAPRGHLEMGLVSYEPTAIDLYLALGAGVPLCKVAQIAASIPPSEYPRRKDV